MKRRVLCGCLVDAPVEQAADTLRHPAIDMVEWRLDAYIDRYSIEETTEALALLSAPARHPVLATNRPKREGGAFEGSEEARLEILRKAALAGAEWVDLEADVSLDQLQWFKSRGTRIVISHHEFERTPDRESLQTTLGAMAQTGAHVVKIATRANSPQDNLRVLELIAFGRKEFGVDVIAFCMGQHGRWSRPAGLLLGSPWTYVQLPGQSAAAPGQFTAHEMRTVLDLLDAPTEPSSESI